MRPVVEVRISELREADSARSTGVDAAHVRTLAQVETPLPPILVHQSTMRIIDGVHRVAAARLNRRPKIDAVFFVGSEEEAFRLGVRTNTAHGLPLSLPDRRAAAARIIASHPQLSDRSIAMSAGLAAKTVAAIRHGLAVTEPTTQRIGRDGRIRPVNAATGRRAAVEILSRNPEATLREVAREAGISVSTAHSVRSRLAAGTEPVPARGDEVPEHLQRPGPEAVAAIAAQHINPLLQRLSRDPSLRYSDGGKAMLRILAMERSVQAQWPTMVRGVSPYCLDVLAQVASQLAAGWSTIAADLAADGAADAAGDGASNGTSDVVAGGAAQ
ncbi:ParB N-terminal domain-containing protein [Catenulispora yoronensis]|uniref:ParB N-terminal domain-containing protein n=1 Tax=Catenulispora yoronensis TaxID=450799 RepID=A0ABP5F6X9_9ACTN